jgi:hypothetical protein
MTEPGDGFKRLSAAEALRALYIDFEGEKDKPPVIVGVHRRGRGARPFVSVDVVDETFASRSGSTVHHPRGRLGLPEWATDSSGFPDGHLTHDRMGS